MEYLLPIAVHYCLFVDVIGERHRAVRPISVQLRLLLTSLSMISAVNEGTERGIDMGDGLDGQIKNNGKGKERGMKALE